MMTFTTDYPESCGIVSINNEGIVENFYEKKMEKMETLQMQLFIVLTII